MIAYLGYHYGLLQGGIFGAIAVLVIVVGVFTYRRWVARSESRPIDRGRQHRPPGGSSAGAGQRRR
jgi:hypothetical protein